MSDLTQMVPRILVCGVDCVQVRSPTRGSPTIAATRNLSTGLSKRTQKITKNHNALISHHPAQKEQWEQQPVKDFPPSQAFSILSLLVCSLNSWQEYEDIDAEAEGIFILMTMDDDFCDHYVAAKERGLCFWCGGQQDYIRGRQTKEGQKSTVVGTDFSTKSLLTSLSLE